MAERKRCPKGKVLNPSTRRCINADGKLAKSLKKSKGDEKPRKSSSSSKPKEASKISSKKSSKPNNASLSKSKARVVKLEKGKCSKKCIDILTVMLALLKAQKYARISLNFGKKEGAWYDSELKIRYKGGKFTVKLYKDGEWHIVNKKQTYSESELLKLVEVVDCKILVLMVDAYNTKDEAHVIWQKK